MAEVKTDSAIDITDEAMARRQPLSQPDALEDEALASSPWAQAMAGAEGLMKHAADAKMMGHETLAASEVELGQGSN